MATVIASKPLLRWVLTVSLFFGGSSLAVGEDLIAQARVDPVVVKVPVVNGSSLHYNLLSTAQGLSQTKINQIVEDRQGFMWFATQYGLNRYDGYKFKVFVNVPGNPNSFGGVFVNSLFRDRLGMIWIGSNQLLDRLDPASGTFQHFPIPYVIHISQDSAGTLWLSTGEGLYSLDPVTGKIEHYLHDSRSLLSSNDVKSSGEDLRHDVGGHAKRARPIQSGNVQIHNLHHP